MKYLSLTLLVFCQLLILQTFDFLGSETVLMPRKRKSHGLTSSNDAKRNKLKKSRKQNSSVSDPQSSEDVVQLPDSFYYPLNHALDRISEISDYMATGQVIDLEAAQSQSTSRSCHPNLSTESGSYSELGIPTFDEVRNDQAGSVVPIDSLSSTTYSSLSERSISLSCDSHGASSAREGGEGHPLTVSSHRVTAPYLMDGTELAPTSDNMNRGTYQTGDSNVDADLSDEDSLHPHNQISSITYGPGFESEVSDESDDEDDERMRRQFPARNYGSGAVPRADIGLMNVECIDCKALHYNGEVRSRCKVNGGQAKFTQCCSKGKVSIPAIPDPPRLIKRLLNQNHILSRHFKDHIRQYNSSLAFASMVASQRALRPGPYSYVVHGQVYHNSGCLTPENTTDSQYAQLYVLDTDLATDIRMRRNQMVLSDSLLKEITQIMFNVNVLAKSYNMMQAVVEANTDNNSEIFMIFDESLNQGSRRHNVAARNQIAAVFVSNDGEVPTNRALVVRPKGKDIRRISVLSPFIDPMVYPLLFPRGERGWSPHLTLKNGKRLSLLQYYAYRLAYRRGSYLHMSGKLFQQFIVDAYCKIEENNLNYVKLNQKKLRAESYKGLMDHLSDQAAEQNVNVGKRIILPSTFTGSPRSMNQHYQDAMRMVSRFGKPDLFLTFTCNPSWKEITDELQQGEQANDRPDLIARVFKMKFDSLLDDLLKKHVMGRIMAHVGVIEFQKRGLPHVHLLLTLHPDDKIRTRKQMDDLICAEIPSEEDPGLREKVLKHMIHGPCGEWNANSPCMDGETCTHSYPKPYSTHSHLNQKGYPLYRRREGSVAEVGRFSVGNEWVVPYNPYLLHRYDAHINVELCASVKSVKYLYKYIYKGHDAASIKFTAEGGVLDYDEIQQFVETRFVSSHEACWRVLRFPMQLKSHAIVRLTVHEENQQSVVFEAGNEEEAVDKAAGRFTTLTGFFALNERWMSKAFDPRNRKDPRNYRYIEIPEHFTFKPEAGWSLRKQGGNEIGRMYFVSPSYIERFHMRLLLLHTKGATSFESLRTVEGIVHPTFKSACQALGLVELDGELEETLAEASSMYGACHVRQVFADILAGCSPNDPESLWEKFKDHMIEDFVHLGMDVQHAEATAYAQIKLLTDPQHIRIEELIPVPESPPQPLPEDSEEQVVSQARNVGTDLYSTLNAEQKVVADDILGVVTENRTHRAFFVDGPGGSGKTYLYKALYHIFRGMGKQILNVAWSGIAAQLLIHGRTCHSAFCLPVPLSKENFMPTMKSNSKAADVLRQTDVIIWDEAPMAPKFAVEGVNILLQDVMSNEELFGGKIVLFGGDFRQIPPIVKEKHSSAVIEATLKRSHIWSKLVKHRLTVNVRAQNSDEFFRKFLIDLGDGKIKKDPDGLISIPPGLRSDGNIVQEIYGDDIGLLTTKELAARAILSLKNKDCDKLNIQVLELFACIGKYIL